MRNQATMWPSSLTLSSSIFLRLVTPHPFRVTFLRLPLKFMDTLKFNVLVQNKLRRLVG
jgi:hypothetical protein